MRTLVCFYESIGISVTYYGADDDIPEYRQDEVVELTEEEMDTYTEYCRLQGLAAEQRWKFEQSLENRGIKIHW